MTTSAHDTSLSSSPTPPATNNPAQVEKEVRFAVVMYGGVSLAVYINGITQELLHMVRSTAVSPSLGQNYQIPYEELRRRPTEAVYRKVSYLLSEAESDRASATNQSQAAEIAADALGNAKMLLETDAPVPVKFVVDIISGSSAGGINGVFLAKALANNQDIKQLQELWVEEGDISKLINDRCSIISPLEVQRPPTSLLNSQRMYLKLLNAFKGMANPSDRPAPETANVLPSPYVEELDLFVTATDLLGVKLPLQLADSVIYERRYRNVFHFMYAYKYGVGAKELRNDFHARNDPFLAYAARCTSSFPFAFEPMSLEDIDFLMERLEPYKENKADYQANSKEWRKFFKSYVPKEQKTNSKTHIPIEQEPHKRPFGDGGDLDNKPFTYATDTLTRRSAEVPVERKLVYIEPSPDHPEDIADKPGKPDALGNTLAALLTLPRAETIREDLQRVLERNRTIARVNRILYGIERDAARAHSYVGDEQHDGSVERSSLEKIILERINKDVTDGKMYSDLNDDDAWAKLDLKEMLQLKGYGYLAYHRLDIASVTDNLARLIIPFADADEESDLLIAVRSIIRAWRDETYTEYKKLSNGSEDTRPTMNEFLWSFNLLYPLRRLNFLRAKIDQLYKLDQQALDTLRFHALRFAPPELSPYIERETNGDERKSDGDQELARADEEWKAIRDDLRQELRWFKVKINITYLNLRRTGYELKINPTGAAQAEAGAGNVDGRTSATPIGQPITKDDLLTVLGQRQDFDWNGAGESLTPEEEAVKRAEVLLNEKRNGHSDWVKGIARKLADGVKSARRSADENCRNYLNIGHKKDDVSYASAIRAVLRHYYMHYDDYDMLTFPILYNSGVGEASYVEVVRFSPDDATALINEMNLTAGEVAKSDSNSAQPAKDSAKSADSKEPEQFRCSKLAGVAFGHFGAFLNRQWRINDILWGRLDGAERIIRTLLPNRPNEAAQLIGEAQAAIVCEMVAELCGVKDVSELATHHFTLREREAFYELLIEPFMRPRLGKKHDEVEPGKIKKALSDALDHFIAVLRRGAKGTEWEKVLDKAINDKKLSEYFDEQCARAGGLFKRNGLFKSLGLGNKQRSACTLGRIFGDISEKHSGNTLWLLVSLIAAPLILIPLILMLRLRPRQATDMDTSESHSQDEKG
jgi:patatin-related protein